MKIDAKDPQTWISRDLFESYCGAGSEKLLGFYDKAVEKKNVMAFSLNWLAILLLAAWFGYRKQWQLFAALSVLCAALPFIEGFFGFNMPNPGLAGGFLATTCLANALLLMSANSTFMKLRKSGMDMEQIRNTLMNRASSSVASAIIAAITFFILQFAAVWVAAVIFGGPLSEITSRSFFPLAFFHVLL